MLQLNLYDPLERQREKQSARRQDDRELRMGDVSVHELAARNGMFSALDLPRARIVGRGRIAA